VKTLNKSANIKEGCKY